MSLSTAKSTPRAHSAEQKPISPESYLFLQQWIYRESGIVIDQDKSYLLHSRLAPVLEREQLPTLDVLCGKLRSNAPGVARQVVDAMTTNETLFFRDNAPFEALRETILPRLIASLGKGQKLALWSAAASSGQEAYSLAMILLEMGLSSREAEVFGSDLSDQVLAKAANGVYGRFEVSRGLPPEYLERYFERLGADWRVKPHVRSLVRFGHHDLRTRLSAQGPFDITLCRNVLIYFDADTKAKILGELRQSLKRGGYLMLGAAETIGAHSPHFERESLGQAVVYRAI
jgi:chemotaxis protein methyltransferase CheR